MALELVEVDESALFAEAESLFVAKDTVALSVFEADQEHVASTSSDDGKPSVSSKVVQDPNKHRMYRERQKNTRETLRQETIELSRELVRVRKAKDRKQRREHANRPSSFFLWKTIALRQREERLYTEAEQRRLVMLMDCQAAYIETLTSVVHGRSATTAVNEMAKLRDTEAVMCDAYIRELNDNYVGIDSFLDECGLAAVVGTETTAHSVHKRESDEVEYYQKLAKLVQPSSLYQTGEQLWKMWTFANSGRSDSARYFKVNDPDNSLAVRFQEETVLQSGAQVSVTRRLFARRFVEEKRIVFLWKFVSEGDGAFRGMQSEETGWGCLLPSHDTAALGTLIQFCQRWTPMHLSVSSLRIGQAEEFHQLVQTASEAIVDGLMTSLEKLLLEDAIESIMI